MRLRLLLLLTVVALSLAHAPRAAAQDDAQPPDAAAWARYTYPGEEFSAELPGMPFVMHTVRGVGRFPARGEKMRVFGRYSGGVVYFVAAYDRPSQSETLDMFASYLRGAWDVSPKGAVTLGGFEGRAYDVRGRPGARIPNELHGEGRVFVAKKHAYLALAFSPEEGRPEVARFLDSLVLGANPAGERVAESVPVPRFEQPPSPTATTEGTGVGSGSGSGGDEERLKLARPEVGAPARDPNARKAIIVYKPEPTYTEEARKKRVSGVVRLRLVLGAAGEAKDISVIKGLPGGLTEKAAEAARYMLFFPAQKDGRPVSQFVVLEYNFNIY
jgi:TonB family protein